MAGQGGGGPPEAAGPGPPHGPPPLPRAYAHLDGNGIDQPEAGNFTDGKDVANLGAHREGDCGDVDDGETVVIYEPGHRGDSDSDVRELFPGDRDVARSIAFAGGHRHSTASPGSVAKCIAAAAARDRGEERRRYRGARGVHTAGGSSGLEGN